MVAGSVNCCGDPPNKAAASLLNIDKYGNVVWSKYYIGPYTFTKILPLHNGNFIGYVLYDGDIPSYNQIVCFASDGTIKWSSTLVTKSFAESSSKPAITQTADGNIVIGEPLTEFSASDPSLNEGWLHFICLNSNNGDVIWETSYQYSTTDVSNVTELPNGNLSFEASMNLTTVIILPVQQKQ